MRRLTALSSVVAVAAGLTGCAGTTSSSQFRRYFVPPVPATQRAPQTPLPSIEAPPLTLAYYANETADFTSSLPTVPRPADSDFLIKRAEDRFAIGKRAHQQGRTEDARREFDQALAILMTAPESVTDRARLERRIETLIEDIYRYDADEHAGEGPETAFEDSPLDGILNMTFPVDPNLRDKVREQVMATASQLPLEESDSVNSYINFFSSTRGKKIISYGIRRSGRYKAMIERILAEEGVPQELIFLAQAESGFVPRAVSRAKCVGIWQFAAFRGREYGLMQTAATDDRMDPEQATRAAARHLHDLYEHFGDWYLAMAAYNCGPGCVDRAIQRTGYADYWQLKRLNALPKETSNYVPAILAMTIMAKNAKDYGLEDLDLDPALAYDTIHLESATHLGLIADAVDRTISELRDMNPSVIRLTAPAGHSIHVPKGSLPQLEAAFHVIPSTRRDTWRVHRLGAGETFTEIAQRFKTGTAAVLAANHADEEDAPEAGSWIAIPVAYAAERSVSSKEPAKGTARKARHATGRSMKQSKPLAHGKSAAPLSPKKPSASATPRHARGTRG